MKFVLDSDEPLRFTLPNGDRVEINVPSTGRVRITSPTGAVREMSVAEYAREQGGRG